MMNDRTIADQTALYELERQLALIRDRVRDVAARRHSSTYIFGPPGTGKTRTVRTTLDDLGEDYYYHSGHLTPMGFFDLLGEHSDEVIVLDDVSSLFRDKIGQQLLLASLGTAYSGDCTRIIRYQRRGKCETVKFTGGVIALSNLRLHDNDDVMLALKSRTKPLCWEPSDAQLEAMMRDAVTEGWERDGVKVTPEECHQVIDFIVESCHHFGVSLDLRMLFDSALPDFAASKVGEHEVDWRDHTLMSIREQVRRLKYSNPPMSRTDQKEIEQKIAERIRASYNTRREQVEAWQRETNKSERAFDRRITDMRLAK
jgi:hypothetical protein